MRESSDCEEKVHARGKSDSTVAATERNPLIELFFLLLELRHLGTHGRTHAVLSVYMIVPQPNPAIARPQNQPPP